ncbi:MAG TPA: penicillin-binding protein activator LpoB [Candidatus Goldiibacteriota bacterium]|nr:penicillin-binding protein activator LpoB [Candidatus Goldiibacteriota bacterium]
MKKAFVVAAAVALMALMAACGGMQVQRVSSDTVTDLSGRWNDTDSQLVAEQIVTDMTSKKWLSTFLKAKGREPRIIVGTIRNKSDEHIEIETFRKDIENALTNSGDVRFVASKEEREEMREERTDMQEYASDDTKKAFKKEKAADFMMKGVLTSIPDTKGGTKAIYYQVDFELFDLESNEKVWVGQKKIKKVISKSAFGL